MNLIHFISTLNSLSSSCSSVSTSDWTPLTPNLSFVASCGDIGVVVGRWLRLLGWRRPSSPELLKISGLNGWALNLCLKELM